jgi:hypothetical protein
MRHKTEWNFLFERYAELKQMYIECEETDPELKTNLQPINEFRAALDHIIRILVNEIGDADDAIFKGEYDKLCSHIRRAFFDVCDMLAINYRNKIIDMLSPFKSQTIKDAIPTYYPVIRPDIEEISGHIASYRTRKGTEPDEQLCLEYHKDVLTLKNYFQTVVKATPSMEELNDSYQKESETNKKIAITGIVIGIAGVLVAIIVPLVIAA